MRYVLTLAAVATAGLLLVPGTGMAQTSSELAQASGGVERPAVAGELMMVPRTRAALSESQRMARAEAAVPVEEIKLGQAARTRTTLAARLPGAGVEDSETQLAHSEQVVRTRSTFAAGPVELLPPQQAENPEVQE